MGREMTNETREAEPESYPMTGGDGANSYAKHSSIQGEGAVVVKATVDEVIAKSLDVTKLSSISNTFCLADLGCSVGPNTFTHMQELIESVKEKYLSQGASSKLPEFQVLFSDHSSNDFNTLFTSLPPEREYFAAGVPGSFYGKLFPDSSVHLVHTSYALQWLSKQPVQCVDENSNAYNQGKIFYYGAASEVVEAYTTQFENDVDAFLKARASEIMAGGLLVILMLGIPKDAPDGGFRFGHTVLLLQSILLDMVKMGKISESKLNSFNIPMYVARPEEIAKAVEKNGDFVIEKLDVTYPQVKMEESFDWKELAFGFRAGWEPLFSKHFGDELMDELFDRLYLKYEESSEEFESIRFDKTLLFAVLKRK